jgi:hypothetical protein
MNEKVIVTSMVGGNVGLTLPHLRVNKTWPKKGTKLPIEKDVLREAIYEPGVEYMFKNGILYIEDMDFKIELGLEEEGAKAPTAVVPVDEKYLERLLKRMPVAEMKLTLKKMNDNQIREMVDYASEQNDIQLDRLSAIKEITGIDLFKVIELKRQKGE